jgi:RNA polymerase sigma-70 factor (ECF subfamily)
MITKDIEKHSDNLFSFAFSLCHDRDLASDLTQECIEKALNKTDQLEDSKKLKPWLATILVNCWKDFLKGRKPVEDIEDHEVVSENTPESEHCQQQIIDDVRQAINTLPISYREVIMLVDIFELSYMEVATTLDVPIGTVMSRISRARDLLRDKLITSSHRNVNAKHLKRIK